MRAAAALLALAALAAVGAAAVAPSNLHAVARQEEVVIAAEPSALPKPNGVTDDPGATGTDGKDGTTGTGGTDGTGGVGGAGGVGGSGTTGSGTGGDDEDDPEASASPEARVGDDEVVGKGSNTGKIVGGVVGGVAGLALLAGLAFGASRLLAAGKDGSSHTTDGPVDVEGGVPPPTGGETAGVEIAGAPEAGSTGVGAENAAVGGAEYVDDAARGVGPAAVAAGAGVVGAGALGAAAVKGAMSHSDDDDEKAVVMPPPATEVEEVHEDVDAPPHDYVVGHGPTTTTREFDDAKDKFDDTEDNVGLGAYNRMGPAPAYAGSAASGAGHRFGGPRGAIIAAPPTERVRPSGAIAREDGAGYNPESVYADMTDHKGVDVATYEGAEAVGDGSGRIDDAVESVGTTGEEVAQVTGADDLSGTGRGNL